MEEHATESRQNLPLKPLQDRFPKTNKADGFGNGHLLYKRIKLRKDLKACDLRRLGFPRTCLLTSKLDASRYEKSLKLAFQAFKLDAEREGTR